MQGKPKRGVILRDLEWKEMRNGTQPILRPDSRKLDAQLETLDRSHQARQNAWAKVHKMTPTKAPKR